MIKLAPHSIRNTRRLNVNRKNSIADSLLGKPFIARNAIILSWMFFLFLFFENGTLGLLPKESYFIYRNVRISDFIIYSLIIYSLFKIKEYNIYFSSKLLIIFKILALFFLMEFIVSSITYNFNFVEYFFRLKLIWATFLIFPFLLLMKRNGVEHLIKIVFPISIAANVLYILTSLTGIKFLPDVQVFLQTLPGGIQVYRVFGGTFLGEVFFLGIIYFWLTKKLKLYQLIPLVIFALPHVLAFGRAAWFRFIFNILLIALWNFHVKRNFKVLVRQLIIFIIIGGALIYGFTKFVPESDYISEALQLRVEQGRDDYVYEGGTYGTRLMNIKALVELWSKSNILFGIGMHPFWVVKPVTVEESIYMWGFSDIKWASVLAAYGLVGFLLALIVQIQFIFTNIKILLKDKTADLFTFFCLMLLCNMLFDSLINYTYNLISISIYGLNLFNAFLVAATVFKYEQMKLKKAQLPSS